MVNDIDVFSVRGYGVFGYEILETEYNSDFTFFYFLNKLYFIQYFKKKLNLEIYKQNKNSILISKIQHPTLLKISKKTPHFMLTSWPPSSSTAAAQSSSLQHNTLLLDSCCTIQLHVSRMFLYSSSSAHTFFIFCIFSYFFFFSVSVL